MNTVAQASRPERPVLSRELSYFLVEFSIALHKFSMYPPGHPLLAPAAASVTRRLNVLLRQRPSIHLGIARHQLLIEGVVTDPKHPIMRELAGRLHRHHLGAISFSQGVEVNEFADVLRTLALEADRSDKPIGLRPSDHLRTWPHVRLHPLSYAILGLAEEQEVPGADPARKSQGPQLWVGLARAALAAGAADAGATSTDPLVVAKSVDGHAHGEAYDRVIVGYLIQIAEELKDYNDAEVAGLRRQVSRFISAMRPGTLGRLLAMDGDLAQRMKFLLDASQGMEADAVVSITQATADASKQAMSESLARLLAKLSAHAEQGSRSRRPQADTALRENVERLVAGWSLANPTPEEYGLALRRMSRLETGIRAAVEGAHVPEAVRMVQMSLEVEALGPAVWESVWRIVEESGFPGLFHLLDSVPSENVAAQAIWDGIARPDIAAQLVKREPAEFASLDRLLPQMGLAAAEPLLDALAASGSRATRRGVLDRLIKMGPDIGPQVVGRLQDPRWFVQRNLLVLLDELPRWPPGFSPAPYTTHLDPRVRRQALKLQLRAPAERAQALATALKDGDPNLVRMALVAAQQSCPVSVVPMVAERVLDRALAYGLRVLGIRVLGSTRSPLALDTLLRLAEGGRKWWGGKKLAPKSPEVLATLAELAAGWGADPRAAAVLARARKSKDPEIRAAVAAKAGRS